MTTHVIEAQLHDFIDDDLELAARPAIEAHVASCAECADRLRALATLRAQLRALPRSIQPAADLLPGIRARLRRTTPALSVPRVRWPLLAAAAVLLCVLSSAVTLFLTRSMRGVTPSLSYVPAAVAPAHLVELRATEARYLAAIEELRAALHRDQALLEPETIRVLEQSLASIDGALSDARAALAADPANGLLAEMLHANYQKKLDLLRRANLHARARL